MSQQRQTQQRADLPRSPSHRFGVAAAVFAAIGLATWALGHFQHIPHTTPLVGACVLLVLVLGIAAVFVRARTRARERMAAFLTGELGAQWDPLKGFRASRYRKGTPLRLAISYPSGLPDHDPAWQRTFEQRVRARMQVGRVRASWNISRNRVKILGEMTVTSDLDRVREKVEERLFQVFKPLFRGVDLDVEVAEWTMAPAEAPTSKSVTEASTTASAKQPADFPARINFRYGVTSVDGSPQWVKRVEIMASTKVGGRWRAEFDPTRDCGYLTPKPVMPTKLSHPGISLYNGTYPGIPKPDPGAPILYYGVDEDGIPRGWQVGAGSSMPHMLCIGPTGGGKTTVLRSLVGGAVVQGIPVFAGDPKMIELTPFVGFPGVHIASTPEEIAAMIESMEKLMYERYDRIKRDQTYRKKITPVLFILDELLIARMVLTRYWKAEGNKGAPPWFDSIAGLLALARSAAIHVVIGVQRPDASLFDDGARDNLRQRLSLMRLSVQGSTMLWGNPYVGVDLPMVQGRAMASPDGENPIEMQTYWLSDPGSASGADAEILEQLRAAAAARFEGVTPPIDVTPFADSIKAMSLPNPPQSAEDLPLGTAGTITGVEVDLGAEDVWAENLTTDDEITIGGARYRVVEVDEDPLADDAVTITVETDDGSEQVFSFSSGEYVSRAVEGAAS